MTSPPTPANPTGRSPIPTLLEPRSPTDNAATPSSRTLISGPSTPYTPNRLPPSTPHNPSRRRRISPHALQGLHDGAGIYLQNDDEMDVDRDDEDEWSPESEGTIAEISDSAIQRRICSGCDQHKNTSLPPSVGSRASSTASTASEPPDVAHFRHRYNTDRDFRAEFHARFIVPNGFKGGDFVPLEHTVDWHLLRMDKMRDMVNDSAEKKAMWENLRWMLIENRLV